MFRKFAYMALAFIANNEKFKQEYSLSGDYKNSLINSGGSRFVNVNIGESPIFFPNKKMKINRKRRLARG